MIQDVNEAYSPLFTEHPRYFFLMGGRGAGRSTVASQYANARLASPEYFRCAIMRYIKEDIRNSIYREIKDRAEENGIINILKINDNQMSIEHGANSINAVGFKKSSGEQKAKLKSLANYNVIIIEEADEIPEADFMQLDDSLRTLKGDIIIIFLLNPPPKDHWILSRWFNLVPSAFKDFYVPSLKSDVKDAIFIRTSYKDNEKNLAPQSVINYESYKNTKPDHYYNMVRGLVPEVARGKIYDNWEEIDEIPAEARLKVKGLDFGYTNDPTALVDIYEWNKCYIVDEQLYEVGLVNPQIAKTIGNNSVITIGDNAEPKSIKEIQMHGVKIIGSSKGKGSVNQGIDSVKSKKIYYTKRSTNIKKEKDNYIWVIDKDGTITNTPRDLFNHAMDAIRYGISFLNPILEKKDEYVQKPYETPAGVSDKNVNSPTPTMGTRTRAQFLEDLAKSTSQDDDFESPEPWQPPGY